MFGFKLSIDNLKEYNKYQSITSAIPKSITPGIETSCDSFNFLGISLGISYGESYLEKLLKKELPKANILDFHTYVICKYSELINEHNLKCFKYINKYHLNKLHLIVLNDKEEKDESFLDALESLDYEIIDCKNNVSSINNALEDARNCKTCNIVFINSSKEKVSFDEDSINALQAKYKIDNVFEIDNSLYKGIAEEVNKRLNKTIDKWKKEYGKYINNDLVNYVVEFLKTKKIDININTDNIKINDNYEEELIKGNNKIINIYSSKSPFIFSLSNNFELNFTNIKDTDKNIEFTDDIMTMNYFGIGLSYIGFKVFISMPLIYSNYLYKDFNLLINESLPITYIFTYDTFINSYNNSHVTYELNGLRLIPGLINFRPCDINEIMGSYAIVSKLNKPSTIVIGSEKVSKLVGTNPKYVIAGAYRVKRERGEATGVLISSGAEVNLALKLAEELLPYNIDLRVVTVPSIELFESQSERYKYTLLPSDLKTFVLEFSESKFWRGYTKAKYILGIDKYTSSGSKQELLNYYNLDMDSLKTRIIELMKDN